MKKCPKCHKEVTDQDQFCPHCGQNLNQPFQVLKWLRMIFFVSFFTVPFLYFFLFDTMNVNQSSLFNNEQYELKKIEDSNIQSIIYHFNSLEDFEKNIKDVSGYIDKIKDYEKNLQEKVGLQSMKTYDITIYDNQDISFILNYQFDIDDDSYFTVCKKMTRSEEVDSEEYYYCQKNIQKLSDIHVHNEQMLSMINDQSTIDKLSHLLLKREDEFNQKKKNIGHFGFGEYLKTNQINASLVIYPDDESFKVILKYLPINNS